MKQISAIRNAQAGKQNAGARPRIALHWARAEGHSFKGTQPVFSNHGLLRRPGAALQTQLVIGKPNDQFEQEADRVADQVMMRMPGDGQDLDVSTFASSNHRLQRKCACGGAAGPSGECEECNKKKRLDLQTKLKVNEPGDIYEQEADRIADQVMAMPESPVVSGTPPLIQRFSGQSNGQTNPAPASVDEALVSSGTPLDPALRQHMEQRFVRGFSRVRVHTGTAAEQSAADVNAYAYTVGHDIVFGVDRFAPGTPEGRRLFVHELTHVVQQTGGEGVHSGQRSEKRGLSPISIQTLPTRGGNVPVALQRKVDLKACLAQTDEILPPIGTVATIDRELTLTDTLGSEYGPLKKQILASIEARKFVCDAGVPAVLSLWDKRTAAGELDVTAAQTALKADKTNIYSKNLDTSWLRRTRLGRAETELSTVAASVASQAKTTKLPRLLFPRLAAPQKENVAGAAKELDALIPVFESATKEFTAAGQTAFQLREQLDHARKEAIKAKNPDYAGSPRDSLEEAVKTAKRLQQELESVHRGIDIGELVKTSQEVAVEVAKLPPTSDSDAIGNLLQVVNTFRKNVADSSTQVTDLAGAARRVSFVLRYSAALNTPGFANPPGKDEMQSMRSRIDLLRPDLELLFGEETAMLLDLFDELGKRINRQIEQRSTMETALGHETELVPPQADVRSFFQTLEKKSNDEVTKAYTEYAQAFFEHQIVVRMEDFNVIDLDEIFARPLSLAGLRPLVCTDYAVLGATLLGVTGAKTQGFIVAVRASAEQVRTNQLDEGHAVAVIQRKGAKLFVSNDVVVDDRNDAIGPDAVEWKNKEFPLISGKGKTVQEAITALQAELARRR